MSTVPQEVRRDLGCGYEPPNENARSVWLPLGAGTRVGFGAEYGPDGDYSLTTCAGYTTKQPAVIDVLRARTHWDKGELAAYCDGAPPTKHLVTAIEVLSGACARSDIWAQTDEKDGGGRRSKA